MFTRKKVKRFLADLALLDKKLGEKTPSYMVTNGITVMNKKVNVLFKILNKDGMKDNVLNLGSIKSVAIKYAELGTDEFINWVISSAMQIGSLNDTAV